MKNIKFLLAILTLTVAFSSIGSAQTSVTVPALNGQPVSVQNQKGKVVVMAMSASWVPLSRNQALILNRLTKKYAAKDVVFYFVATDSTSAKSKNFADDEQIRSFVTKNKITVPVLRDSDGLIMKKSFKADQVPAFVILDKNGNLAGEPYGGITPDGENVFFDQISKAIDELL